MLSSLGVNIPVGTSDAGAYFNNRVLAAVDYGVRLPLFASTNEGYLIMCSFFQLANVHPWFANVTAEQSAAWTADFFQQQNVAVASSLSNNPKMYIAETGWPTVNLFSLYVP